MHLTASLSCKELKSCSNVGTIVGYVLDLWQCLSCFNKVCDFRIPGIANSNYELCYASEFYTKNLAPIPDNGPLRINSHISIIDLGKVDENNFYFSLSVHLSLNWPDSRLKILTQNKYKQHLWIQNFNFFPLKIICPGQLLYRQEKFNLFWKNPLKTSYGFQMSTSMTWRIFIPRDP